MEQNPFYPSENASSSETKGSKKPEQPQASSAGRTIPAASALERVISLWDRQAEAEHRRTIDESPAEHSDDDSEDDKDTSKKGKTTAKSEPQSPHRPTPLVTESESVQPETSKEASESDESDVDTDVAASAPPAESVVHSLDEGENPADDTHVVRPASTPRVFDGGDRPPLPPIAPHKASPAHSPFPANEYAPAIPEAGSHEVEATYRPQTTSIPEASPTQPNAYPWSGPIASTETAPASTASEQTEDDATIHHPISPDITLPSPPGQYLDVANQPPDPNYSFANQYLHPAVPELSYDTASFSPNNMPNVAPVMPIEHPLHISNRDPGARQAAAILGVGLWAEHRGRKKADRQLKKANERTEKRIGQQSEVLAAGQRHMQERQRQFAAEQERLITEVQRMQQPQERFVAPPIPPSEQSAHQSYQPRRFESTPDAAPVFAAGVVVGAGARPSLERPPKTTEYAQAPAQNSEQAAAEHIEQQLNLAPNQHVEHSAWHNIVVDERGHEVAGAIEYGEGFQRERQQEAIRDRMQDGQQQGAAASQYQQDHVGPLYPGALPTGMTAPALPQGRPTHADPQHQLASKNKQPSSNMTNPWFWIMILLILAAFFTAALV